MKTIVIFHSVTLPDCILTFPLCIKVVSEFFSILISKIMGINPVKFLASFYK